MKSAEGRGRTLDELAADLAETEGAEGAAR